MSSLTKIEYWDQGYISRKEIADLAFGWRNHANDLISEKIEGIGLEGKNVLEVGAGDSQWLPYLSKKYSGSRFSGLDYSKAGCERLAERITAAGIANEISVYQEDILTPKSMLHGKFDLVLSFGVVEHFTDLSTVLSAKRNYLSHQGLMFTLIPNMAGSIGYLTKLFNRKVYEMHNPHDWPSFLEGHHRAGLTVISGGYLGSLNYGILSSCVDKSDGIPWHIYVFLTRLSKLISIAEIRLGDFPSSKMFSPYIYAISKVK
jgi:2-polyprenyl-3-methyl-5-hydroxy-6-metoxy-1,4-benzoquinol methylase